MTEQELRELVRQAIAHHASGSNAPSHLAPAFAEASADRPSHPRTLVPSLPPSHLLFVLPESDGPCLIEPAVSCTHCGYCKSLGH